MLVPTWIEAVFVLAFCVVVLAIAAVIGRAAWLRKPKNWDRSTYWTVFVVSVMLSGFLMVCSQRMRADVRTWTYGLQVALFFLGVLLLGVAGGCFVGIFTYGRGRGPVYRAATPRAEEHSTDSADRDQTSGG